MCILCSVFHNEMFFNDRRDTVSVEDFGLPIDGASSLVCDNESVYKKLLWYNNHLEIRIIPYKIIDVEKMFLKTPSGYQSRGPKIN